MTNKQRLLEALETMTQTVRQADEASLCHSLHQFRCKTVEEQPTKANNLAAAMVLAAETSLRCK